MVAETAIADGAPRIRVLAADLVDQIAAGEVVERPASVVKELVENALDAGARRIDIEIEAGGRRLMRVVDDGCGMTPAEAQLSVQRHATSKIEAAADLWGLRSFGFRGEALPSIAAVARVVMSTKVKGTAAGFRLGLAAGVQTDAREVGMPDGTQIEVRDLFFNTPGRLKFLKTEATEAGNVSEAVLRLALAHPGVHFRLRSNDRVALDLPPHRDMAERVRAALARRGAGALHEALGEENGARVRAYLAAPEEASSTARSTFLFVGRRFIRDRSLLHAFGAGFGELLEKGRYPLGALFVDVPGDEVDVNVHPQKLEVRFARAQEVYAAVRHVVAASVAQAPWLTSAALPMRAYTLPPERFRGPGPTTTDGAAPHPASQSTDRQTSVVFPPPRPTPLSTGARDEALAPPSAASAPRPGGFFAALEYIGQLHRTYLVCQGPSELILVDQHAAHERVAFQRLREAHRDRGVARQQLFIPATIDLDEGEASAMANPANQEALGRLGFDVEVFGPRTVRLRAAPALLPAGDPKPLLLDVLHRLGDGGGALLVEERLEHVLATMACHSVTRAGDVLSRPEVLSLLGQLDDVDLRSHCPHGRPVLLRMPIGEIERRFGRT